MTTKAPRNSLSCGEVGVLSTRGEGYVRQGIRLNNKLLIIYGQALLEFANWQPVAIQLVTKDLIKEELSCRKN